MKQFYLRRAPVFVHIEKAGGMTIHHLLNANDGGYVSLNPRTNISPPTISGKLWTIEQQRWLLRLFPRLTGIGGHWVSPLVDYTPGLKAKPFYMTFVRAPIARYLSHYRYQKKKMGIERTFEEFVDLERFHNFQVKKIAGCEDLEKAKIILRETFSFVGILEHFDESLLYFQKAFGENLDLRYVIENRNIEGRDECEINLGQFEEVMRRNNKLDLELYRFVEENVFSKYRENWLDDGALDEFRASLVGFNWTRRARFSWKVKSLVVRRGLQGLASRLAKGAGSLSEPIL